MKQNKFIWVVVPLFAIGTFILFVLRFIFGGSEDSWICANGEWLRHGNPSTEKPLVPCD